MLKYQLAEPAGAGTSAWGPRRWQVMSRGPRTRALARSAPVGTERGLGGLSDRSQSAGQCPPPRYDAFNFYFQ